MAYCHRTSHHLPICQVAAFPKAIGAGLKANTQVLTIDTSKVSTSCPHSTPQQREPFPHCMPRLRPRAGFPDQKAGRRATSSE